MVEHKYISTEINKKPTETVYEIKDEKEYKVPSFEEFMKTYNEKEEVNDNYQSEFDSYGDLRTKGTYYGPGFWDDIKSVVKPIATGALVVGSFFPPTAPFAVTTIAVVGTTGLVAKGVGHVSDEEGLKKFGDDLIDIAGDSIAAQGGEVEFANKFRK